MPFLRRGRSRRIVAFGGVRGPADPAVPPQIERFTPTPIDEGQARREIEGLVSGLAPAAVDEATGGPLDNLINALADQWVADVRAQHARYVASVIPKLELTEAEGNQVEAMRSHDRSKLSHMIVAVESALLRLSGATAT